MTTGLDLTAPAEDPETVVPDEPAPRATPWWRDAASWSVLVALLVWAVPFTHEAGGRDPFALTYALLALVPALVLVQPWRSLGRLDLLALTPAALALLACFVAPSGFDGLRGFASYTLAGVAFVIVRGYLGGARVLTRFVPPVPPTRAVRIGVVLAALTVAGVDQFLSSWWAWYGGGNSAVLMVGTFYWHNQFAVFMAALGLLGGALALRGTGRLRWAGGVLAVLAVPSLAFAGSRSTLLAFALCWVLLAVVSLRRPRSLMTLVALPAVGVALALTLASPAMMTAPDTIASNVAGRETAVGNGQARLAYDEAALRIVADRPLTGSGAGTFASVSAPLLPDWISQPTAYVHNGFLQAFVDGGVPLGLAVTVVALLPLVVGLRRVWRGRLGRSGDAVDAVTLGSLAALGLLAVHSAVDTDWSYPSLLVLYAVVAALVCAPRETSVPAPTSAGSGGRTWFAPAFVTATVLLLLLAVPASVRASAVYAPKLDVPAWAEVVAPGVPLADGPAWMRGTTECSRSLSLALAASDTSGIRADLDCLAELAESAPSVEMLRARGLTRLGEVEAGTAIADRLANAHGDLIPNLLVLRAALPADAGRPAEALAAVRVVAADPRVGEDPMAAEFARTVIAALSGNAA